MATKRNLRLTVFTISMIAVMVIVTFLPASAQLSQWRSLNPTRNGSPTATISNPVPYLYGVHVFAPDYGWAVGGSCEIYASAPNYPCSGFALFWDGVRWYQVLIPPSSGTLTSVFIVSPSDVWAVGTRPTGVGGARPTILHWNGVSWVLVTSPDSTLALVQDLFGVFMLPGGTDGWVVGTATGGGTNILRWSGTWPTGAFSPYPGLDGPDGGTVPDVLRSVNLLSSTQGWIVGSGTVGGAADPSIFKWDGAGWLNFAADSALIAPPTTGDLLSVFPVSASDAWAVGESSTIIRWNGASWTGPMVPPTSGIDYRSVHMVSPNDGWIAGTVNPTTKEGLLLRWDGIAWSIVRSWVTVDLNDIHLLPTGAEGAAVGDAETIIYWKGSPWFAQTSPTFTHLRAVSMASSNDGWAVGDGGNIFRYNGNSWAHYETLPSGVDLYGLHMRDSNDGWAVGASPSTTFPPTILRWNGAAWTEVTPSGVALGQRLRAVDTVSPTESWAVGTGQLSTPATPATVLKWDGTLWTSVPSGTPAGAELFSIDMISSTDGWAVGCTNPAGCSIPMIVRWNGLAWSAVTPPVGITGLLDVFMLGPTDGWAVGYAAGGQATIIHWDGVQWTRVPGPSVTGGGFLNSVYMVSPTDGWAVGLSGEGGSSLIVHWNGLTWDVVATLPLPANMVVALRSVFMTAPLNGWIVSDQGLILKYGPESVPGTTTSTSTIVTTTTSTSTTSWTGSTPTTVPVGPVVPGFPIESILAGLLGGLIALTIVRRRRRPGLPTP